MMNERLFDLAMKSIAGHATADERAELESALAENPQLRDELARLQEAARVAKEMLPVVAALESTAGELPAYARERLQTKVRETLGRPPVAEHKSHWATWWFWVLATVTVAVVGLLVIFSQPKRPEIQLAMIDIAGMTRGSTNNQITLLQQHWVGAKVRSLEKAEELQAWEKNWPATSRPVAKVVFDPAAAEVRVVIKSGETIVRKTVAVENDLPAALEQADAFIKTQVGTARSRH